jgi:NADPH2:quinone reductase
MIRGRGCVEIDPRDAMRREASILGALLFAALEIEQASFHAALHAGLESGTLRAPSLASRCPWLKSREPTGQ